MNSIYFTIRQIKSEEKGFLYGDKDMAQSSWYSKSLKKQETRIKHTVPRKLRIVKLICFNNITF